MALTSIDFSQIENIDNTPTGININKAVKFNQQLAISSVPPQQENTTNIWFNKSTEELKIKINNFTYDLKPSEALNSISIGTNTTFNLNGKRGIVNNFTITGTNTVITVRGGNSNDWSILEIQGNLTIPTGCTLNLIRTPLIVRGNIVGGGTVTSPNGVNGGLGGVGGPGGAGGTGLGGFPGIPGTAPYAGAAPTLGSPGWTNGTGGSASSMPIEYGINSGSGGPGGRGTAGGGVGGAIYYDPNFGQRTEWFATGGYSGNGNPGGDGYLLAGGGGGGAGGGGTSVGSPTQTGGSGGPGAWGTSGTSGGSAQSLTINYIGIGTPNNNNITAPSQGSPGGSTFGGAGGQGASYSGGIQDPTIFGSPGQTGGRGGDGAPGGSTGGTHLTIFCIGTIDATTIFKPGKGGINGGLSNGPKAQTGSLWLFSQYGTNLSPNASVIDLTGIGPSPSGSAGTSNRISISDTPSVNSFFRDILYNSNGSTPAKSVIVLTL
jgi:hypothetical protein